MAAGVALLRRLRGRRAPLARHADDRAEPAAQPRVHVGPGRRARVLRRLRRALMVALAVLPARPALLAGARRPDARAAVARHRDHRGRLVRADAAVRPRGPAGRVAGRRRRAGRARRRPSRTGGTDVTSWSWRRRLLVGLGLGFVFGPLFNVILAGVDERRGRLGVGHAERDPAARQLDRRRRARRRSSSRCSTTATPSPSAMTHDRAHRGGPARPDLRALLPPAARGADGGVLAGGPRSRRAAARRARSPSTRRRAGRGGAGRRPRRSRPRGARRGSRRCRRRSAT